ncbi:peptidase M23B [Mycoplasma sp. CAG:956]|nr:peptidase M23B [Mycoplasma sp. CAG:956]
MKKRRRLRKYVIPTICLMLVCTILFSSYKMYQILTAGVPIIDPSPKDTTSEVNNSQNDTNITPTVSVSKTIIRPYTSTDVSATIPYYNIDGTNDEQAAALIYYEGIYMQNTGVLYTSNNTFDVVSILDGTVKNIKEDSLMGNIVEIEHTNNLTTVYQSLGEVKVKVGDKVKQGDIIATSGQNKIATDTSNALHFEVFYKGEVFNPEEFYLLDYNEVMSND